MAQLRVAPGGEHVLPKEPPQAGGFDFGLAARNARLAAVGDGAARVAARASRFLGNGATTTEQEDFGDLRGIYGMPS